MVLHFNALQHWAVRDLNPKSQSIKNSTLTENSETQRVQKSAHIYTFPQNSTPKEVHGQTLSGDLQRLALVWDSLPENVRVAILALAGINLEKKMEK
ncbi:MAG: hypothetical protein GXY41_04545 [Phycisphaerae bacterium]|nr:hypothetical protein [Phycisphaerae bacterium]